tara:strand:- start:627 stop:845 length:219 start_codon:yes stop_codon:yes gene_type:complete
MRKTKKVELESNGSVKQVIGFLFVSFAAVDFISSYAGVNLTPFLGPVSAFSPIIFGSIGWLILNSDKQEEER